MLSWVYIEVDTRIPIDYYLEDIYGMCGYVVTLVSAYPPIFRGCFKMAGYSAVKTLWVLFVLFSFKKLRIEVKYYWKLKKGCI